MVLSLSASEHCLAVAREDLCKQRSRKEVRRLRGRGGWRGRQRGNKRLDSCALVARQHGRRCAASAENSEDSGASSPRGVRYVLRQLAGAGPDAKVVDDRAVSAI